LDDDSISDPQRREIFFVHQFVAAGRRDAQHFRYCRRVQEQRQFVIVLVDRFFHSCPPLFVFVFSIDFVFLKNTPYLIRH